MGVWMKRGKWFFRSMAGVGTALLLWGCAGLNDANPAVEEPAQLEPEEELGEITEEELLAILAEAERFEREALAPDPADAVYEELEKRAAQNDADAWFELGKRYYEGFGCERPPCEWALRCFRKSDQLKPNAEVKMFLELCGRRIAEEKAAEQSADEVVTPVDKALTAHFQEMRRHLGSENVDSMLDILKAEFGGAEEESLTLRAVKLPGSLRLAGWNFDPGKYRDYLAENTIDDREGFPRWMTEEFSEMPLSENLLPINPSIRVMNGALENLAAESLNQTYLPCDEKELEGFREIFRDAGEYMDQVEFSGWKITSDVYFVIFVDYSGAWRLRTYRFLFREGGRYYWFSEDDRMPEASEAAVIAGYLLREPNSLNNIAVRLSESSCKAGAFIEELLKEAAEKGCVGASYNLGLVCLSHGRKAEAEAYLRKALERLPELQESFLAE